MAGLISAFTHHTRSRFNITRTSVRLASSLMAKVRKLNHSIMGLNRAKKNKITKPSKPKSEGKVLVLINGGSSSATSLFVAMMKLNHKQQ